MNESIGTTNVSTCLENETGPVPPAVPGEFVVKLGAGWGGSLHDLADGLAGFELGGGAAVSMMLTWCQFVEIELRGFDDLLEQLHLLRGALVTAGIEAVGTITITIPTGELRSMLHG